MGMYMERTEKIAHQLIYVSEFNESEEGLASVNTG